MNVLSFLGRADHEEVSKKHAIHKMIKTFLHFRETRGRAFGILMHRLFLFPTLDHNFYWKFFGAYKHLYGSFFYNVVRFVSWLIGERLRGIGLKHIWKAHLYW